MKICLMPHPNTLERFSYLISNFRENTDIEICFPEENFTIKNADIFILEDHTPLITECLLSMENPPLIVILKEGISQKHIRYLPKFPKGFSKLLKEIAERTPTVRLNLHKQACFYNQTDILWITYDKNLTIYFRQGNKITSRQSFRKIAKQLSPQMFFPVGENTFVNTEYVSKLTDNEISLQNGQKIPFDSAITAQVKNAFFKIKYLNNCFTNQPAR